MTKRVRLLQLTGVFIRDGPLDRPTVRWRFNESAKLVSQATFLDVI